MNDQQAPTNAERIIRQLVNSRSFDFDFNTHVYSGPVVDMIRQISASAEAKGLTLSRWQANKPGRKTVITYAIHSGARADQARHQSGIVASVVLLAPEGKTSRCDAYAQLVDLIGASSI